MPNKLFFALALTFVNLRGEQGVGADSAWVALFGPYQEYERMKFLGKNSMAKLILLQVRNGKAAAQAGIKIREKLAANAAVRSKMISRALCYLRLIAFGLFALLTLPCNAQVPTMRPKITGISYVRFKSTDLAQSRAFYEKTLGLSFVQSGCNGVSNPCFVINPLQHVELMQALSGDNGSFLSEIGFATSDVKQMHEYLQSHGVNASPISRRANGALFLELEDPEHNHIVFVENSPAKALHAKEMIHAGNEKVPNPIGNQMLHAGFVVKNLGAMKKFYLDLLGFRLYWYGGFKDDGVDWYEIQVPDGSNWVEFMLNISPTADRQELGVQNHFSLGVGDANAAATELRARGATKFDGPEVGRDGKNSLDIYDPDFSRVEVMDLTPSQTPCCHAYTAPHPKACAVTLGFGAPDSR